MNGVMSAVGPAAIVVLTVATMELVAVLAHRYIMHGFGWSWHRSHHEPTEGKFEKNDLYAVVFAGLSIVLFMIGSAAYPPLFWIATGMTIYGALYFIAHDGLVHQRWPFRHVPRQGYLKRLVQAHRLHHAVEGREGCVSFGFLYAPPVAVLRDRLRQGRAVGPRDRIADKVSADERRESDPVA
jgi:beta-carotene 3-hydroxylase